MDLYILAIGLAILAIAVIVVGIVAIKSSRYWSNFQKRKKAKLDRKLQEICPHAYYITDLDIVDVDDPAGYDLFIVESFFEKPFLSGVYTCKICGMQTSDKGKVKDSKMYWEENIGLLMDAINKYHRILSKRMGSKITPPEMTKRNGEITVKPGAK